MEGPSRTDPPIMRGRTRGNKAVNFSGPAEAGELAGRAHRRLDQPDARRPPPGDRRRRLTRWPVAAIFGPTASGKSAVALALAGRVGGEIVSCDAMQAYRGLPILTNQPRAADLAAVPHHLVGVWPLDHARVGGRVRGAGPGGHRRRARARTHAGRGGRQRPLPARRARRHAPAGRSRRRVAASVSSASYDRDGAEAAHGACRRWIRAAAAAVHPNDRRRVVRALELHAAGESLAPDGDGSGSRTRAADRALRPGRAAPEPAPTGSQGGRGRCSSAAWWRRCATASTAARSRTPPSGSTACRT